MTVLVMDRLTGQKWVTDLETVLDLRLGSTWETEQGDFLPRAWDPNGLILYVDRKEDVG